MPKKQASQTLQTSTTSVFLGSTHFIPLDMTKATIVRVYDTRNWTSETIDIENIPNLLPLTAALHQDVLAGAFGAQVYTYAYITIDLTQYKPAQIILLEVDADSSYNSQPTAAPQSIAMAVNVWGGPVGTDFLGGSGAVFHGDMTASPENTIKAGRFMPNVDVSIFSQLTIEVAIQGGYFPLGEQADWIAALGITISVAPVPATVYIDPEIEKGTITTIRDTKNWIKETLGFEVDPFPGGVPTEQGYFEDVVASVLGAQVWTYASVNVDLTIYKPAKIILSQVQASVDSAQLDGGAVFAVNIWGDSGVSANWFAGTDALFHGDLGQAPQKLVTTTFLPNVDVSSQSKLVVEAAIQDSLLPLAEHNDWFNPGLLALQVTPIISLSVHVQDDVFGAPLAALVNLYNSAGVGLAAQSTDINGNVVFSNLDAGIYIITATVGATPTSPGRTLQIGAQVFAQNSLPLFIFDRPVIVLSVPTSGIAGNPVSFDDSKSHSLQGQIVREQYSWNDGSPDLIRNLGDPGFLQPVTHTYISSGLYNPFLFLTDEAGLTIHDASHFINVAANQVLVKIQDDQGGVYQGVSVQLINPDGTLNSTAISDSTGTAVFVYTPNPSGPINFTVKATLALNGAPGITKTNTVLASGGGASTVSLTWYHPIASFTSPAFTDPNTVIVIDGTASSSGESSDPKFSLIEWLLVPATGITNTNPTGSLITYLIFPNQGIAYTVQIGLLVQNDAGLQSFAAHTITVNPGLTADFTWTPTNVKPGDTVNFASTISLGVPPYSTIWNFGDGSPLLFGATSPSHVYSAPGNYNVTLSVFDSLNGIITVVHTLFVRLPPPSRIVMYDIIAVSGGFQVTGLLTAMGDVDGNGDDNIQDVSIVLKAFGTIIGQPGYVLEADFDNNGQIEIQDAGLVEFWFGRYTIPITSLDGQTISIQAMIAGSWVNVATVQTAQGTRVITGQTTTVHGLFTTTISSSALTGATAVRAVFNGNLDLGGSNSQCPSATCTSPPL